MFPSSNSLNPFLSPQFLPQNEEFVIFKEKPKRNDRHSKICTANGLRDRRVRLSIDVADKFFKLQDMLGFDTASKTILWLLSSSESSIKEVKLKNGLENGSKRICTTMSQLPHEVEMGTCIKEKKVNKKSRGLVDGLSTKESRARARARARERTRRKIVCTQKINETNVDDDANPSILNRFSNLMGEIEACEGLVMMGDEINGSLSYPKFEKVPIVHRDWEKNLLPDCQVFRMHFEDLLQSRLYGTVEF